MDCQPPKPIISLLKSTTEPPDFPVLHPSISLLAYGIFPAYPQLSIPSFNISTFPFILRAAQVLDPTHTAANTLLDIHNLLAGKWDVEASYGFCDIIGLATPVLRDRGNTATKILVSTPCSTSIISSTEGFVVFYLRLLEYITQREEQGMNVSMQTKGILQSYESLVKRFPEWESEALANDPKRPHDLAFLEAVHDCWNSCEFYFLNLAERDCLPGTHPFRYSDLMVTHIKHAVNWWGDAWENIRNGTCHPTPASTLPSSSKLQTLRLLEAEGMHLYFSYLPRIVADLRSKCYPTHNEKPNTNSKTNDSEVSRDIQEAKEADLEDLDVDNYREWEALVHEAWFTMIFRAMCWWRLHRIQRGKRQVSGACETGQGEDGEGDEAWEFI
ncbi:MAG: hypothetical protein Q9187_007622 [Circinaria calcarea]